MNLSGILLKAIYNIHVYDLTYAADLITSTTVFARLKRRISEKDHRTNGYLAHAETFTKA